MNCVCLSLCLGNLITLESSSFVGGNDFIFFEITIFLTIALGLGLYCRRTYFFYKMKNFTSFLITFYGNFWQLGLDGVVWYPTAECFQRCSILKSKPEKSLQNLPTLMSVFEKNSAAILGYFHNNCQNKSI